MSRRRLLGLLVAVACCLSLAACGDDDDGPVTHVALDGTPRIADHAGVLGPLPEDFSSITIGDRTFAIDPDVQSFSAVDASAVPLRRWENQLVLVGLDDDEEVVQWLSGVGAVVRLEGRPEVAYFTDVLVEIDEGLAIFRSGTTLRLDDEVDPSVELPASVVATVDADSGSVSQLAPA